MDQKGYVPPMPAYQSEQLQQGAYPHPAPPPAYDVNPPQYPGDVPTGAPYAPSPQHHHPQQMHPTVVHTVYQPQVGPEPTNMTCPSCRQLITTNLDYEAATKTHLSAVILCLLFWPCAWLPYCMDTCKNANHYCPNCNAYIGTYNN